MCPDTDCWEWIGAKAGPYGTIKVRGAMHYVHRIAYRLWIGDIPKGMQIDHFVCDNPICFNPDHLRLATPRENTLRSNGTGALNAAKDRCPKGHKYDWIDNRGHRQCKTCRRESFLAFKERQKA